MYHLLLGVPVTIGPVEQQCCQLQRLLTSDEKRLSSAAANTLPELGLEVPMRLRIEQAILDTQLCSSASQVICKDSDLYLPFK